MRALPRRVLAPLLATLALAVPALGIPAPAARAGEAPAPPAPAAPAAPAPPTKAPDALLSVDRLMAHVRHLAAPALAGRGDPATRRTTAQWVAARLEEAGAKPPPGHETYLFPFRGEGFEGWNVAGWIPGTTDEYVVASAHFDHLGTRDGVVHPGADDNASGVAALIEATRALAAGPPMRRSVLVVAFDLEEDRLKGSRAFAQAPPLPLERCAAFTTADMLGRSLADLSPGLLLVMGEERADGLREVVEGLPLPDGVVLARLGMDFNALGYSDYVPFEERKIPSLFFCSGACRDYHRPTDVAERIDAPSLAARATAYLRAVRSLADAERRPVWIEAPPPRLVEIEALLAIVRQAGAKADELGLTETMRAQRKAFEEMLEKILARGAVTPAERGPVRFIALQMFAAATRAGAR